MKYAAPIIMIWVIIFNFIGYDGSIFGRFQYFFPLNLLMCFAFIELSRITITGIVRNIYKTGVVFFGYYTMFQMLTLFSKDMSDYFAMVRSFMWSYVLAGVFVVFIILTLYDEAKQTMANNSHFNYRTWINYLHCWRKRRHHNFSKIYRSGSKKGRGLN